ncbi:MAG: hypothetical protein JWL72_2491 [Ilumatobacteraceae bacterium]|nr:hypothetical protein [Ilumatobacteraceae bacterium]MCU1389153.1 hypothetical protein [Ilumatobacteraceae bacterium]
MNTADLLHPGIATTLGAIAFPTIGAETLAALRAGGLGTPPPLSDDVERTDIVVSEDPHVVIRVHRPKGVTGALPCLYSMHGGGYVLGSSSMDDSRFDQFCTKYPCVGVSVEYRLAPETPYPGPLDDCYAGLTYVFANAASLGIDPTRIGIGGVSAGGGLAAALALLARDRGEVSVAFQLLECPMVDDRQSTMSSQQDGLAIWSRESNTFGWQSYLGNIFGTDDVPHYAAPARATDLSGLPPAFVAVGTADGFRDEDIAYATRLNQAGVPTELHVYPGLPHGHMLFAGVAPAVAQWQRDLEDWLGRQFQQR